MVRCRLQPAVARQGRVVRDPGRVGQQFRQRYRPPGRGAAAEEPAQPVGDVKAALVLELEDSHRRELLGQRRDAESGRGRVRLVAGLVSQAETGAQQHPPMLGDQYGPAELVRGHQAAEVAPGGRGDAAGAASLARSGGCGRTGYLMRTALLLGQHTEVIAGPVGGVRGRVPRRIVDDQPPGPPCGRLRHLHTVPAHAPGEGEQGRPRPLRRMVDRKPSRRRGRSRTPWRRTAARHAQHHRAGRHRAGQYRHAPGSHPGPPHAAAALSGHRESQPGIP